MFREKVTLIVCVILFSVLWPRHGEARGPLRRLLFGSGGGRGRGPAVTFRHVPPSHGHHVPIHHAPVHHNPQGHSEPEFVALPSFDDADQIDGGGVPVSDSRGFYSSIRNQLLLFGTHSPSIGLQGRCFDGSHWSSTNTININISHGRLRIGHSDAQITFREDGWIQFLRSGRWWEHHFVRSIGNGRYQYFRRTNGGHWLRCTLNSISEIRGNISLAAFNNRFGGIPDATSLGGLPIGSTGVAPLGAPGGPAVGPGGPAPATLPSVVPSGPLDAMPAAPQGAIPPLAELSIPRVE